MQIFSKHHYLHSIKHLCKYSPIFMQIFAKHPYLHSIFIQSNIFDPLHALENIYIFIMEPCTINNVASPLIFGPLVLLAISLRITSMNRFIPSYRNPMNTKKLNES